MAKEIIMPKFGFTQEESEILEWLKQPGDVVEKGDPVAVVSTDKISMEVESPESGILEGIRYKVGDVVPVTEIIAYILQSGEKLPTGSAPKTEKMDQDPDKRAESSAPLKISAAASASPVAARLAQDQRVDLNQVSGTGKEGQITKKDVEDFLSAQKLPADKVNATPAARRIAHDKQISLTSVSGTGPHGRLQAADVVAKAGTTLRPEKVSGGLSILQEIPLIGMRRTIAQNMQRSMQEAPHMTLQVDVEMDAAEGLRKLVNQDQSASSGKISVTALIVKAVAFALKQNPIINSRFADDRILIYKNINVGVATALENGLIVPVIHDSDQKDLRQLSTELTDLAEKARENKLQPDDLSYGTFTISNLGMYGIDRFTAIINPPQTAILAVGKMNSVFLPDEHGQPVLRKIITMTLSADHRVMDGTQAAKFLTDMQNALENLGDILK